MKFMRIERAEREGESSKNGYYACKAVFLSLSASCEGESKCECDSNETNEISLGHIIY